MFTGSVLISIGDYMACQNRCNGMHFSSCPKQYVQLLLDEVTSTTRPIYGSCEKPQSMSQHIFILVGGCFAELRRAEVEVVTERKLLIFKGDLTTIIIFHKTHQCFIQVQTPLEYSECLSGVGWSISLYMVKLSRFTLVTLPLLFSQSQLRSQNTTFRAK